MEAQNLLNDFFSYQTSFPPSSSSQFLFLSKSQLVVNKFQNNICIKTIILSVISLFHVMEAQSLLNDFFSYQTSFPPSSSSQFLFRSKSQLVVNNFQNNICIKTISVHLFSLKCGVTLTESSF